MANRMKDGGISERGGASKRGNSLFQSPTRRLTEGKKGAGTVVPSPSGKTTDFHADIKELMKNKQKSSNNVNTS